LFELSSLVNGDNESAWTPSSLPLSSPSPSSLHSHSPSFDASRKNNITMQNETLPVALNKTVVVVSNATAFEFNQTTVKFNQTTTNYTATTTKYTAITSPNNTTDASMSIVRKSATSNATVMKFNQTTTNYTTITRNNTTTKSLNNTIDAAISIVEKNATTVNQTDNTYRTNFSTFNNTNTAKNNNQTLETNTTGAIDGNATWLSNSITTTKNDSVASLSQGPSPSSSLLLFDLVNMSLENSSNMNYSTPSNFSLSPSPSSSLLSSPSNMTSTINFNNTPVAATPSPSSSTYLRGGDRDSSSNGLSPSSSSNMIVLKNNTTSDSIAKNSDASNLNISQAPSPSLSSLLTSSTKMANMTNMTNWTETSSSIGKDEILSPAPSPSVSSFSITRTNSSVNDTVYQAMTPSPNSLAPSSSSPFTNYNMTYEVTLSNNSGINRVNGSIGNITVNGTRNSTNHKVANITSLANLTILSKLLLNNIVPSPSSHTAFSSELNNSVTKNITIESVPNNTVNNIVINTI